VNGDATMDSAEPLVHDWNAGPGARAERVRPLAFLDESLRDGLQSPSVSNPPVAHKARLLHLMSALGIGAADLGLPGAGARAAAEIETLCREIAASRLGVAPACAARTTDEDLLPALEIMQRVGAPLEIMMFMGASPVRRHVEGWTLEQLLRRADACIALAVRAGAPVTFVTEDTTRSHPDDLKRLYRAAVRAGASRVCLADTAGAATPTGAARLVAFIAGVLAETGGAGVGIDWHGHNDRGLALAVALAAAEAGADRVHATVLGIGERVGNPPMEQLLVNARMLGWASPDLSRLGEYVALAGQILGVEVPPGAPVVGRDAFRTSTGVHAAAVVKAFARGGVELADLVYSAVPAAWLARVQEIDVGPMSGSSNVRHWLVTHGYPPLPATIERIFAAAKAADRPLSDAELHALAATDSPT
jgi:2-isopropylmalate synthase